MSAPSNLPTRPLIEVALGFIGAILVVPLLFKVAGGLLRGLFRFRTSRRLVGDLAIAGITALLTREDVLNRLFGRKGRVGDGLLKSAPDDRR